MEESRTTEQLVGEIRRRLNSGFSDQHMMERAVHAVHAAFQAQFYSQGGYGGAPWAPLAESTIRRRSGASYRILIDSGEMEASLTQLGAAHSISRVVDGKLEVGTDLEYAGLHQTGTPNMPSRELVTEAMLDQEGDQVADVIGSFILGELEGLI